MHMFMHIFPDKLLIKFVLSDFFIENEAFFWIVQYRLIFSAYLPDVLRAYHLVTQPMIFKFAPFFMRLSP